MQQEEIMRLVAIIFVSSIFGCLGYMKGLADQYDQQFYEGKIKKIRKGKLKMPRIYKYILYGLLVVVVWKFVANIEEIASFLISKIW